jgi:voltage-gated potassium channel
MSQKIIKNFAHFFVEISQLVYSQVFIVLTVVGNGLIGFSGTIFYFLEKDLNPNLHYIDAIWWSFATATTTGYGDITPKTFAGKFLGILLMLAGTAIFAMYTGLFAETILKSEYLKRDTREKNRH